jgi:hypothetical protein
VDGGGAGIRLVGWIGGVRPFDPLPDAVTELARGQEGLISARQLAGLHVPRQRVADHVRRGQLVRVDRGVYDVEPTSVSDRTATWAAGMGWPAPESVYDHRRRRSAIAVLLRHGDRAVAVGLGALALLGAGALPLSFRAEAVVRAAVPRAGGRRGGVRRIEDFASTTTADGWAVATWPEALAQAVLTLGRWPDGRRHGVAIMDDLLHREILTVADLADVHRLTRGRPGVGVTHGWWEQADGRAESPLESHLRHDCLARGHGPDTLQLDVVTAAGVFVGRVDLVWLLSAGRHLFVEVDGVDVHSRPDAVFRDRERQNGLTAAGRVLRYTKADLDSGRAVEEIGAALRRAGWRPATRVPARLVVP